MQADTLYLRDGSRVQGELISVRNGTIEFEERRSFGSGRTLRLDRDEVVRIEFENRASQRRQRLRSRAAVRRACASARPSSRPTWRGTTPASTCAPVRPFTSSRKGQVRWGTDRRDGPAGERNSPSNPNRPMGNRNAAALIGKIGSGNDLFFIGDETGPVRDALQRPVVSGHQRRCADR